MTDTLIYEPTPFGFVEIEQNDLPDSITGYVEATCGGGFPYVPPAGYEVVACEQQVGLGSHGGCEYCIVSKVTCVSSDLLVEEIPDEDLPVEEIPVEDLPVEEIPVEDLPVEEIPVEEIPVDGPIPSVPTGETDCILIPVLNKCVDRKVAYIGAAIVGVGLFALLR